MREAFGDIWELQKELNAAAIVITTNGFVKKNGEAVMGRGIALEAKERYPELPKDLGRMLALHGNKVFGFRYSDDDVWLFTMPVKPEYGPNGSPGWKAKAEFELIKESALQIVGQANYYGILKNLKDAGEEVNTILVPRPGCGNGGLKWEQVKPIIEPIFDDRFIVVTKAA